MHHRSRNALFTLAAALATLCAAAPSHAQAQQAPQPAQRLYDPNADARADVNAALARARADHKLVLLDFGADWCVDCWILERLFQQPQVQLYLEQHFHVVRIDVGQFDHNLPIANKYGSPIEGGVPAVVVLAPTGAVLATTRDGSMEAARRITPADLRQRLEQWVALAPR
jgi:thiol:disulfide interchange protein